MQNVEDVLRRVSVGEIDRQIARRDIRAFTERTFPGYETNWHHEEVFKKVDEFVFGDLDRLMIFMPPRHGKSEIVSRRLPAFILGNHPGDHVIGTSYSATLSSRMNRDVQRIIDSRAYNDIFPDVLLPRSTDLNSSRAAGSAGLVRTTNMFEIVGHRGSYVSAGVGGSITGMGGDWIIIDDPVKNMEDAVSTKMREKVWEWYTSTLYTRLEKGGKILLTMTRWHSDDLAGRLLEKMKKNKEADQFEVLNLPALSTESSIQQESDKRESVDIPLWEGKKNRKDLERVRQSVPGKIWGSLYQQNPTPDEGSIWKRSYIRPIKREDIPKRLRNWGSDWDLAYTSKEKNSASAWVSSGVFNGNVYITGLGALWLEFPELIKHMKSFKPPHYIENKASGRSAQQVLRREGITEAYLTEVESDKLTRTYEVTPFAEQGRIFVAADLYDFLFEDSKQGIIHLTEKNTDIDLNDALTQAIKRHLGREVTDWSDIDGMEMFNKSRVRL